MEITPVVSFNANTPGSRGRDGGKGAVGRGGWGLGVEDREIEKQVKEGCKLESSNKHMLENTPWMKMKVI